MKKKISSHDDGFFITLKTNTMKTDANLHPFPELDQIFQKKFVILAVFLTPFYVYK